MFIDTHAAVRELEAAGLDTAQAEAIVKTIAQADERIATKADIERLDERIGTLRSDDAMDVRLPRRSRPRDRRQAVRPRLDAMTLGAETWNISPLRLPRAAWRTAGPARPSFSSVMSSNSTIVSSLNR